MAQLASLADETPEGRSIVVLTKERLLPMACEDARMAEEIQRCFTASVTIFVIRSIITSMTLIRTLARSFLLACRG